MVVVLRGARNASAICAVDPYGTHGATSVAVVGVALMRTLRCVRQAAGTEGRGAGGGPGVRGTGQDQSTGGEVKGTGEAIGAASRLCERGVARR